MHPFLLHIRISGISFGNGFNIFASVPPAKIMYVFSLFAFRSLRSLHASRENPIGGEWVRRVTVSLAAYLNTPHFLFSFF